MKQVIQAIKSLFRKWELYFNKALAQVVEENENSHLELETKVSEVAANADSALAALDTKLDIKNPRINGSLAMNLQYDTNYVGTYATCLGSWCTATGGYALASGSGSVATGNYSTAMGHGATASGVGSFAFGEYTTAKGEYQLAHGKFNVVDANNTYAHIIGNGTGHSSHLKSNAYTLDWSGNGWFAGSVEATALILKSPDGSRFNITVDDSGNLIATKL